MTKKSKIGYIFLVLTIFSLSLVSSQTLIAGKVYNADFSDTISDVNVKVICNNGELNTNTLGDGTFAVRFEETACSEGNSVSVSAGKSGFQEKTGSGTVSKCEDTDCEEPYVTIINLGMKLAPSDTGNPGGGSSGRYYLCGNGKCDSGESVNTCPADCKTVELLTQTTATNGENITGAQVTNNEITGEAESETTKGFFSGITGAVIGTLGTAGTTIVIIFLIIIIASAITLTVIRKRNKFGNF